MNKARETALRAVEAVHTLGFSLIVASVVYFIIAEVVKLVGSDMLDWSFCGSVHYWGGPNWCGVEPTTGMAWFNTFGHKLLTVPLPWFMIFWGFLLVGICFFLLQALGFQYNKSINKDK
ncbi:MAG: hypothetical protein P4M15_01455 [Alphaproteobacteria bacterium]|nr:hypothetical protein [Alphaproteobacteria bacterium]